MPPTTLGVLRVFQAGLPGSTRSGEKARKKSFPPLSPVLSSAGSISSRVVPGYVVDSSTTSWPCRRVCFTELVAASTKLTSGSLVLDSGVGTRSEEHTSELQSQSNLVCRLLLEKKNRPVG